MAEQQANNQELLNKFSQPLAGQAMETYDPLEQISTFSIGEDIKAGTVIAGTFLATEKLVSDKFTLSKEIDPETGKKVQYRHVIERGGVKMGIWNVGELKLAFSKIAPGTAFEFTYKGKGMVNDRPQHQFTWKTAGQKH